MLSVERKIRDVDVARCLEDTSRLPVQLTVVPQHHTDALEVWNQLLRPVATASQAYVFSSFINMAINRPILAFVHIVHMFILYFCFRFCLLYIFVCMYFFSFFFLFLTTILVNKDVYIGRSENAQRRNNLHNKLRF